jgi:hypothetical protein
MYAAEKAVHLPRPISFQEAVIISLIAPNGFPLLWGGGVTGGTSFSGTSAMP